MGQKQLDVISTILYVLMVDKDSLGLPNNTCINLQANNKVPISILRKLEFIKKVLATEAKWDNDKL